MKPALLSAVCLCSLNMSCITVGLCSSTWQQMYCQTPWSVAERIRLCNAVEQAAGIC